MKILKTTVLEWSEVNGKKYPKKVVYLVDKLPEINKGGNNAIDIFLDDENLQMDRKRK